MPLGRTTSAQRDDLALLAGAFLAVPAGKVPGLLRDLLTAGEIAEFANRFRVASMLADGVPYAKIVEETGASSTTVARVSKFLRGDFGGYRAALQSLGKARAASSKHHRPPA